MSSEPLVSPQALRDARIRAGFTQHQLARVIDIAGGERISRWERGESAPRPEVLHRIAAALNVTPVDLLTAVQGEPDLRRLRMLAGLSAQQIADRTHISIPTYARWESGHLVRMPSIAAREALAAALGVGVETITAALTESRRSKS